MKQIPRPGEFYRHFKDKLYQIIAVAEHSETGEAMVVYQALYGEFKVYVRPLEMFLSPVDKEKYPEVSQELRFERVELGQACAMTVDMNAESGQGAGASSDAGATADHSAEAMEGSHANAEISRRGLSPLVLPFVEADSVQQRLEILSAMRGKLEQADLDVLYVSMDLPQRGGDTEVQLDAIEKYLQMQLHFEGKRLR